jgi:hypothetical protein
MMAARRIFMIKNIFSSKKITLVEQVYQIFLCRVTIQLNGDVTIKILILAGINLKEISEI